MRCMLGRWVGVWEPCDTCGVCEGIWAVRDGGGVWRDGVWVWVGTIVGVHVEGWGHESLCGVCGSAGDGGGNVGGMGDIGVHGVYRGGAWRHKNE